MNPAVFQDIKKYKDQVAGQITATAFRVRGNPETPCRCSASGGECGELFPQRLHGVNSNTNEKIGYKRLLIDPIQGRAAY